jgi:CopG family nickel-responsive transcriptional regulator
MRPATEFNTTAREADMSQLVRYGVSVEKPLSDAFDSLIQGAGYTNRSEAIRDLIRQRLIDRQWAENRGPVVGTLTLVYDHHVRGLTARLTAIQHDAHAAILSTLHLHLDHHHCLEVLVLRGKAAEVQAMADRLGSIKGVAHCRMTFTAVP